MSHSKTATRLLLLAALCAAGVCGCRKRETIDVSSLHTTAAVEKESLKESEEKNPPADGTSSATIERETQKKESGYTLTTEIKKEDMDGSSVEYPVIAGMKDEAVQDKANALLKANVSAFAASFDSGETAQIEAKVESINLKRITITYRGEKKKSGSSNGERIFFSNTVDLEKVKNLGLSDYADPYTIAGYIASGDYKLSDSAAKEAQIRKFINRPEKDVNQYYEWLKEADLPNGGADTVKEGEWPEIFSYEKQGAVFVSLPLPADLGSYVLIHYSPDNK